MKLTNFFKPLFLICCLPTLSLQAMATQENPEQQANKKIQALYEDLNNKPASDMAGRITTFSRHLLGMPYLLGALGEGSEGRYDQAPLYRMDAFDCETYVDTVLALAFATDLPGFKQCIRNIRYRNGHVSFIDRNHFMSLDWNKNNQHQGFVKDISLKFRDKQNQPVSETATALIDKPGWYKQFDLNKIRLIDMDKKEQLKRLKELKRSGQELEQVVSSIAYIPLTALFDGSGKANDYLFKQIPHAAIIEIVRPNWNLRDKIGTNLNVSHLGFAILDKGILLFRDASSLRGQTADMPLVDYLRNTLKSPTIKGINVHIVLPQQPLPGNCRIEN